MKHAPIRIDAIFVGADSPLGFLLAADRDAQGRIKGGWYRVQRSTSGTVVPFARIRFVAGPFATREAALADDGAPA